MTFLHAHLGEIAALATAVCWTLNAMAFEDAGKRVGSLAVNYLRFFVAFPLLTAAAFFTRGAAFPADASASAWFYLSISGLIGFVLGDIFLFQALVEIGSRISLLIKSMGPPLAALAGFLILGESISPLGLVFSKLGMGDYNPLAATQIRIIAAFISFTVLITLRKKWPEIRAAFKDRKALGSIAVGAVLGPFIGVTLSLAALQHAPSGIVSSLTSLSPILIIPFSVGVFKEKVLPKEILGALISIIGVIILFLR